MRDPDRLDSLYNTFHIIHKKSFPDLRFGQMISNFFSWCESSCKCSDVFYVEDNEFESLIKEYANDFSSNKWSLDSEICHCFRNEFGRDVCYGTKEREQCSCGGDKDKCDFY